MRLSFPYIYACSNYLRLEPGNCAHVDIDKLKYIHVQMWRMTS